MALSAIYKIYLIFLPRHRERIVKSLQGMSLVHLIQGEACAEADKHALLKTGTETTTKQHLHEIENRLSRLQWMIDHLEKFRPRGNLLEHFATPRQFVTPQTFQQISAFDENPLFNSLKEIAEKEHQLQKQMRRKKHVVQQLELLQAIDAPLSEFKDTRQTFIRLFIVEESFVEQIREAMEKLFGEAFALYPLSQKGRKRILLLIGKKEQAPAFDNWVENQPIETIRVSDLQGKPSEIIAQLKREINAAERKLLDLKKQLQHLSGELEQLQIAYDYWQNERERLVHFADLLRSQFTEILVGWIRRRDIPVLENKLKQMQIPVGWQLMAPSPEDSPPVDYENPPLVKPFEFVTDLYSRPRYWEMDPTPFLSAFFALFFGICLTDAGYGLILMLVTALALKKLPFATENSRKLVKILFYSGMVTTVVGIFTGGIFGVSFQQLPSALRWLQHLVVLNPLKNQMGFLAFTLSLGILHVGLGIFLKFYRSLRSGEAAAAWFDQAPWLAILLGVVVLGVASLVDQSWLSPLGYVLMLVAAAIILLFAGRSSKNPFLRFAQGLYSLYQVSGLLGDILSYARLFALGLATGVIAGVVNFLAKLTLGIPYLGFFIMPLVLIGGHLMNLIINALGGFIHTSRLQYVEFFGKFYEGGGEPFQPFQLKLNFTKLKEPR